MPRDHVAIFVGSDIRPDTETTDRAVIVDAIDFFNSTMSFLDLTDITSADGSLSVEPTAWADALNRVDVPTDV